MNNIRFLITLGTVLCLTVSTHGYIEPKIRMFGRCPKYIQVQQNFDAASYMGVWHEQAWYETGSDKLGHSHCVTAEYALNTSTGIASVHNTDIDNKGDFKRSIKGSAVLNDPSKKEAKLTVTFHIAGFDVEGMYWVLGTDYNTYSVVYACQNMPFVHYTSLWILGREQVFSSPEAEEAYFNNINAVLRANKINPSVLTRTVQTNCTTSFSTFFD